MEMRVSSEQRARGAERVQTRGETVKGSRRVDRAWHGGQGGGIWGRRNTNMRIKAVEGIKAYNHGADL